MKTKISSDNIQTTTLETLGSGPTITNVQITDSSYNVIDDTAVSTSGGYLKITGTNFSSGCTVIIGGTNATSTAFVNSTTLNVQVPASTAGTYVVYVVNTDGGVAIRVNGLTYSGTPTWVTGSTLPQGTANTEISIQLSATSDSSITYTVQSGSNLPTGLTLSSSGLLSGTVSGITSETTYNFTIEATDSESQESPRTFSITITVGDTYWRYVTTLLSPTLPALPFNDDASTNNFVLTINGDTKTNSFNPYTPGYYSAQFDGTGDYLSGTYNTSFPTGNDAYTIEAWIYLTGTIARSHIVAWGTLASYQSNGFRINDAGNGLLNYWYGDDLDTGNIGIVANNWYHVVAQFDGTTRRIYLNGVSVASANTPAGHNVPTSGTFAVGSSVSAVDLFTGYISNLRIVKGTAVYTTNFTPNTTPLTAITNTSLLTCQSNRFIDNSTNNFTITKNGDTKVTSFIPYLRNSSYSTYGSTYFDGTGDFLSTPTGPAAFDFSTTKTLTLEFWVNSPSWGAGISCFFDLQECQPFRVLYTPGTLSWQATSSGSTILSASVTLAANVWYHIAFVRNTDTVYIFVNGVQVASGAFGNNWGSTASGNVRIGCNRGDTWFVNGYMTDVRLVKGTALYTTNFTPPTQPLTAIANTSLLTCQTNQPVNNNEFLDSSTNNLLVTRNGNATQGTFSPYGENWSNYFDGTGDVLTIASNANLAFGTGNFTVELWYYASVAPTASNLCLYNTGTSQFFIQIRNTAFGIGVVGSTENNAFTYSFVQGVWYHIAVCRSGTTVTGFVNGTSVGTGSNSVNYGQSGATIGGLTSASQLITGYISNLRIVKGTAVYSSNFTPSTTPLQPIAGTQLLTCQSPSIVDNSPSNLAITKNGDVSVQKFGPFAGTTLPTPYYSAYFDGTGDYLSLSTIQNFGTADFTVEAWVYLTAVNTNGIYASTGGTGKSRLYTHITNTGSKLQATLRNSDGTNEVDYTGSTTINLNTWYHVAIVRYNNTLYLYVNGVSDMTPTPVTQNLSTNDSFSTVGSANATRLFNGYMSNLRVVAGTAVYTANFTPPTSPLTAITNTSLLTCQSSTLVDNSINNVTITVNGDTKPRTFNPFTVGYSINQSYTPSVYGGSMYLDGNGDGLTIADATLLAFGTGDFTIEFWIYLTGSSSTTPGNILHGGLNGGFGLYLVSTGIQIARYNTGGDLTYSGTVTLNSWTHLAFARKSGTGYIFLNGAQVASGAVSTNYGASSFNFGGGNALYYSDLRIIKGQALYTSGFVPQNKPLTAVRNSTLLLNGTSAGIYDSSENTVFETVGDAKLSTSTVKFSGSTSMYFDGTGDYLVTYKNTNLYGAQPNFTAECWVYVTNTGVTNGIMGCWDGSTGNNGWTVQCTGTFKVTFGSVYFNSTWEYNNLGSITANTWTHVALVVTSAAISLYVNGVNVFTSSEAISSPRYSGTPPEGSPFAVGVTPGLSNSRFTNTLSYPMNGYISDCRITKGYARYTTNFTAPTTPFINK